MRRGLIVSLLLLGALALAYRAQRPAPQDVSVAGAVPARSTPSAAVPGQPRAAPNIVLVVFEDMSPRVGAYGDAVAQTPAFDRIAAEGVRYTHVYTAAPVCAPSRAALITGRHAQTLGAQHMRTHNAKPGFTGGGPAEYMAVPPQQVKAFPELLRAAGYYAINNGKTDYQFGEPFTVWDESGAQADWSNRPGGAPFFSMVNLLTTHEAMLYPPDFTPRSPEDHAVVGHVRSVAAAREAVTDPARVTVPPWLPDTPAVRTEIARLYDNIHYTDAKLGELYARLEREGLLDETILIVTTDHGDGLPRAKRSLYDSGLHVPLVIRYPDGHGAGTVNDALVSFVDLAPTILAWAGIDAPAWMQGRIMPAFGVPPAPAREYVFAARDRMDELPGRARAVRDARYKYIRNLRHGDAELGHIAFRDRLASMQALWDGLARGSLPPPAAALFAPLPDEQLYDTRSDPDEILNLADDSEQAAHLARLRPALDAWQARVGDLSDMSEVQMIEAMWPGGVQPRTPTPVVTRGADGLRGTASAADGASIGYRYGDDAEGHWRLYVRPFELPPGQTAQIKAIRYGYAESETVTLPAP